MCTDLLKRLNEHNIGQTKSTKALIPWTLIYFEEFESREDVRKREVYFKTAAGRRYLKTKTGPVVQRIE